MKKRILLELCLCLILLTMAGCRNRIDYSLPDNPIEFNTDIFINPSDANDTYLSLEYNERVYIPYGNLKGSINGKDVAKCLGYYVQDGNKMEDTRLFLLTNDSNANFLMRIDVVGVMSQPDFFRAVDTKGEDIHIPQYIDSADEPFWN